MWWRSGTYDKVRDNDLQNFGLQACPFSERPLKKRDHQVAQWSADESSINCHLRHAAGEVMTMLVAILGNPGREELLQCCQRAGCEHFRAQWVLSELLQIPLQLLH